MARWHTISRRKPTGGLLRKHVKRKNKDKGSEFLETRIGERKTKARRMTGGGQKDKILSADFVNVSDPSSKVQKKAKIVSVESNPANIHYVRRNVLTKGAIVKTELGNVRITSRPGQTGSLSGVLIKEQK
jgi:small subunit ribosomal protein S8e